MIRPISAAISATISATMSAAMSARMPAVVIALLTLLSATVTTAGPRRRAVTSRTPTFNREVVRILQQNCQSCHRPGGAGPFSLTTYEEASGQATNIANMVSTRQMPPWKPSEGCGEFQGTRRLSTADITALVTWTEMGTPQGSPLELPPPLRFSSDWALGTPNLELRVDEPYMPPAEGDTMRCFVLPATGKTRYVSAIDFKPLARESVHHMIAYIDYTQASQQLDAADPGPGYSAATGPGFDGYGILGAWFPGAEPFAFPDGIAVELPAGARVVLQVHYHPGHGKIAPDQSQVGLYFSSLPVTKLMRFLNVENRDFTVPANNPAFTVDATWTLPRGIEAYSAGLHSHFLGRKMLFEAVSSDGTRDCLIREDSYDWKWQGMYQYVKPRHLPGGTSLRVQATYDNSGANPENPNRPPRDVSYGEHAVNEMCIAYLAFTWDDENVFILPE